jgi:hypothetical protein
MTKSGRYERFALLLLVAWRVETLFDGVAAVFAMRGF